MARLVWEKMAEYAYQLERIAVPGGWLVRTSSSINADAGIGICFYPDPQHLWE